MIFLVLPTKDNTKRKDDSILRWKYMNFFYRIPWTAFHHFDRFSDEEAILHKNEDIIIDVIQPATVSQRSEIQHDYL